MIEDIFDAIAQRTHEIMSENHVNFFYQNILENDVTSFSIGRLWLYFYGPILIGIHDPHNAGGRTLYLLRKDTVIEGIISPAEPTELQFETIRARLNIDELIRLDHDELSRKAFSLASSECREKSEGGLNGRWLLDFLVDARSRRLCTDVSCTTCGAREFRNRLRAATTQAIVDFVPQSSDQHYWAFLTKSLAGMNPDQRSRAGLMEAVRLILCDLAPRFWGAHGRRRLHELLKGSWAGDVLTNMEAHEEMIRQRKQEHEEQEERSREQRAIEYATQQRERIARKRIGDRQWRERGIIAGQRRGDLIGGPSALAGLLLESVKACGTFSRSDVVQRYLNWWTANGFDTGPVAEEVFDLAASGMDIDEAANLVDQRQDHMTAGCAPLHRNIVLASVATANDEELDQWVREEACLTHRHPLAADAAVAAARIARGLVKGMKWDAVIDAVLVRSADLARDVRTAVENWDKSPVDRSGFSPAVLNAALHFVGTSHSFDACLQRSLEFSGDDNYVPVLAGALAGARWGCPSDIELKSRKDI